jgi:tetratricopeptide (TPR) repeat protein
MDERTARRIGRCSAAALALLLAAAGPAAANAESTVLRAQAAVDLYNLDLARALDGYRAAVEADAGDAAAHRGLAGVLWINESYRRGTILVDSYLGRVSRGDVKLPPPPPGVDAEFQKTIDRAIALVRERLHANDRDPDALYELGAAVGLRASYAATIGGGVRAAFGAARQAYDAHDRLLEIDPSRHDAGLIVGTYRYLVAALSLPLRWFAYVAGFGGGREHGLRLVEGAAAFPGDNQTDARVALVLLYNRERRYGDALDQLARLRAQYPRNRLFWLESGSTALRAGRAADAERFLNDGIGRLHDDPRPRMYGEEAIWYFKRGAARAALGRTREAEADLTLAASREGRAWVHGRARLELGKLALDAGDASTAREELRAAIALGERDGDAAAVREARRLLP